MITVIAAKERRKKEVVDLPGAYPSTPMEDGNEVIITLQSTLAKMMVLSSPEAYQDHMTLENSKKILYVRFTKALCGLLKCALLFYRKLWGDLARRGFEINPYDPCVANKVIDGHQMIICWHVNSIFMLHQKTNVMQEFVDYLERIYGKLSATIGEELDYMGMHFNFVEDKVEVVMEEFTLGIMADRGDQYYGQGSGGIETL